MSLILNPYSFISVVPFPNTKSTDFDGVDDRVVFSPVVYGYASTLDLGTTSSESIWLKQDTPTASENIIAIPLVGNYHMHRDSYAIYIRNYAHYWAFNDAATMTAINTTDWIHVAIIRTGVTTCRLYINGVDNDGIQTTAGMTANTLISGVGASNNGAFPYQGLIDEYACFDEVKAIGDLWDGTGKPTNLAAESGLVAWYRMGDSAVFNADSQWEFPNQPQINNWSSHSFEFDGVNDYVELDSAFATSGTDWSISFWFKTTMGGGGGAMLGQSSDPYIALSWSKLVVVSSDNSFDMSSTAVAWDGVWHHAVFTYNYTTGAFKMYWDGSVDLSQTATTGVNVPTLDHFGARSLAYGSYYEGNLDGISYFSTELTSGNVTSIYNSGEPTDLSTYSTKSFEFDGVDDYIDIGTNTYIDSASAFSVSCWVKITDFSPNLYPTLMQLKTDTTYGWMMAVSDQTSYLGVIIGSGNSGTPDWVRIKTSTAASVFTGNWVHVVATYNGNGKDAIGNFAIYVNGASATLSSTLDFATTTQVNQLAAAAGAGSLNLLEGNIDSVSIWNIELTSVQVTAFYNSGKPTNLSAETGLVGYWRMGEDAIYNGATTEFSLPDNSTNSNSGTSANMDFVDLKTDAPLSPVGYWRMGEGADWNNTNWQVPDYSKNALFSQQSFEFDGVDDEIVVPYNSNLQFGKTQAYSISCWVYAPSWVIASKKIFGTGTWATAAYLSNDTYSGGFYSVLWRMGGTWPTSAGYGMTVKSGFVLSPATWVNIIITYDGNELGAGLKMYINGAAPTVSTDNWGANAQNSLNSSDFTISLAAATGWPGNMDEISVWRSELTSTHIAEIYNSGTPANLNALPTAPAPTTWYRMGESSTFNDDSNWEIPNYTKINNFSSHSFEFDGSDDYVSIDGVLTQLGGTTVGAMSCWVKPTDATPSATEVCLSFGDTNAAQRILMFIDTAGKLNIIHTNTSTSWNLQSDGVAFSDNTWTHIAVVQNGVSPVLYIDSVAVAQTFTTDSDRTLWFANVSGLDNGRIGDYNYNSAGETSHFDGNIDGVSVWDRVITAGNVSSIFNSGVPNDVTGLSINGLVGYWRMGEGATWSSPRWSIPDDSEHSNNGVANNMGTDAKKNNAPGNIEQGLSDAMNQVDRKFLSPGNTASGESSGMNARDSVNNAPDNESQGVSVAMIESNIVEDVPT